MRISKLAPAIAAAMLLAFAPAGAFATHGAKHTSHKHPNRHTNRHPSHPAHPSHPGHPSHPNVHARQRAGASAKCRLSIQAAPRLVTVGEPTSVSGQLVCGGAPAPNQSVTVYEHSAGSGVTSIVGSPITEEKGDYQVTASGFMTNTQFFARSGNAQSAHRTVRVQVQVTPEPPTPEDGAQLFTAAGPFKGGARSTTRLTNQVTFAGRVNPVDTGAIVVLQRENATANEEWHRIGITTVNGSGKYLLKHTFGAPGDANIRIVVRPAGGVNAPGATTPVSYEISQAGNPLLTIKSSLDPITAGGSVTITGVVAGAKNQPITLLAHARGGTFAPIATATTDANGNYTFTQAPLTSTFYQVTSATTNSAVLFEGVKFSLGPPSLSASTVQAGQPLTVSGTVAPTREGRIAGHAIYLERQNPSKIGFHVVEVGTVTAAGTYSITHTFFTATPGAVLRVKIPGDPENQGVGSAFFTMPVTAAPAFKLKPEAPGKLPSEGQT